MVILTGLHVMSHDFSDELPCSDIRVNHNISVTLDDDIYLLLHFQSHYIFNVDVEHMSKYKIMKKTLLSLPLPKIITCKFC